MIFTTLCLRYELVGLLLEKFSNICVINMNYQYDLVSLNFLYKNNLSTPGGINKLLPSYIYVL